MKNILIGFIVLSLFSVSALAENAPTYPKEQPIADLRINAGWAVGFGPDFFGSANLEFKHRPVIDIRYKDRLRIFGPKIGYSLFKDGSYTAGPLLNYSFGRKESDNPILMGLGDNGGHIELGVFASYKRGPSEFRIEGKSALGDNAGETLTLTIMQGLYSGDKISWLMVLRSQLFSQSKMQSEFGITEQQSAMSVANLSAYRPSGGISNSNLIVFGEYKLKQNVSLMVVGSFWQLMSDAKNSPLIKSDFGKDFQSLFATALIYKF